ncbi:hypothetical protein PT168_03040 [Erysipelothrix rhusiopathiae]|nr:hypothetical protein [Erysipelothrix rhusiopathiae]
MIDRMLPKFVRKSTDYLLIALLSSSVFFISIESEYGTLSKLWEGYQNGFQLTSIEALEYDPEINWWTLFHHGVGSYIGMMIWGTNLFQLLLPLFITIVGINIYLKKNNEYFFELYRYDRHSKFMLKKNIGESLKVSAAIFSGYLLFYIFTFFVGSKVTVDDMQFGAPVKLFIEWLPKDFFLNHCRLYHLLWGIFVFFIVPFIYGVAYGFVVPYFQNLPMVTLAFTMYFIAFSIASSLFIPYNSVFRYMFDTSAVIVSGAYSYPNTLMYLSSLLVPIITAVVLYFISCRRYEV